MVAPGPELVDRKAHVGRVMSTRSIGCCSLWRPHRTCHGRRSGAPARWSDAATGSGPVGPRRSARENETVIAALAPRTGSEPGWGVQPLSDDGSPLAEPELITAVAALQRWEAD